MKSKVKGVLMQLPAWILLIGAFITSLVLKIMKDPRINSWGAAVILGIIVILYFWGRKIENRAQKDIF